MNGDTNYASWTQGLGQGIDAFDVELARLSTDGLLFIARNGPFPRSLSNQSHSCLCLARSPYHSIQPPHHTNRRPRRGRLLPSLPEQHPRRHVLHVRALLHPPCWAEPHKRKQSARPSERPATPRHRLGQWQPKPHQQFCVYLCAYGGCSADAGKQERGNGRHNGVFVGCVVVRLYGIGVHGTGCLIFMWRIGWTWRKLPISPDSYFIIFPSWHFTWYHTFLFIMRQS